MLKSLYNMAWEVLYVTVVEDLFKQNAEAEALHPVLLPVDGSQHRHLRGTSH